MAFLWPPEHTHKHTHVQPHRVPLRGLASGATERIRETTTMARLPRGKRQHPPSHSEALKAKWLEPTYRAKMAERDNRREEQRKADPERFSRLGVPNGMRKEEAMKRWNVAEKQADKVIQTLKAAGMLPSAARVAAAATIPDTEAGMAEAALREAFKLALGPTGIRAKQTALTLILRYTRLPPMGVLKVATGDITGALDEIAARS